MSDYDSVKRNNIDEYYLPKAAKSSRASENSPSSMPSPTYQWTKARLAYIKSNSAIEYLY